MEMPADKKPFTQEEEAEIFAKFKASTKAEMALIKTILKYMLLYQKAVPLELAGQIRKANFYLDKLYSLPGEVDLKRDAWMQTIQDVTAFAQQREGDLDEAPQIDTRALTFEKIIQGNIEKLNRLIDGFHQYKSKYHSALVTKQIHAFKNAMSGWEEILQLRITLLKMGGKDFFDLFDGTLQQRYASH